MGLLRDCHPDHEWHQLFNSPSLAGFNATARYRTWCIGSHRHHTTCLHDPFFLQEQIEHHIASLVKLQVADYLVASADEVRLEAMALAGKRGVTSFSESSDFLQVLTTRELDTVKALDRKYAGKFGEESSANRNLCYFLGDSAAYTSWSASSGCIPTFRMNCRSSLFWLPHYRRCLTSKEKLVAMGFPMTLEQCQSLRCESLGSRDMNRASDMIGNCFHFQVSGIMQILSLCCFGPRDVEAC